MSAPGVLFQIVFTAASFYLEGTGRARPGLVAMAGANLVNFALNWLLIGGRLGFPELGAPGAALASTLARALMVVGLLVWMLRLPEFAGFRGRPGSGAPAAGPPAPRCAASASPAAPPTSSRPSPSPRMAQAAGLLGAEALAAYTILHNVETTVFMVALGISVAGRGPHRPGRRRRRPDRGALAGFAGLVAAMGLVGLLGLGLLAAPRGSSAFTAPTRR